MQRTTITIKNHEVKQLVELSKGGDGIVYKAMWDNKIVAIKQHTKRTCFENEIYCLSLLAVHENPYIVKLIGHTAEGETANKNQSFNLSLMLVLEYMPKGDLSSYVISKFPSRLDFDEAKQIAYDVCCGLDFLHENGILYRDLKPENTLLDQNGHAKLCDFSFSGRLESNSCDLMGTADYIAPEILIAFFSQLSPLPYSKKSDMYSYAFFLYFLFFSRQAYPALSDHFEIYNQIFIKVMNNERPAIPIDANAKIAKLIRYNWMQDPAQRFTTQKTREKLENICASQLRK